MCSGCGPQVCVAGAATLDAGGKYQRLRLGRYGNFDNILDHFTRMSQPYAPHAPRVIFTRRVGRVAAAVYAAVRVCVEGD